MPIQSLNIPSFRPAENAAELIMEITSENARSVAFALQDAMSATDQVARNIEKIGFDWNTINTPHYTTSSWADLPAAPALAITGVQAPSDVSIGAVSVPALDTVPVYVDRSASFTWDETLWDMSLINAAKAKLLGDLMNGGYGIEPTDEQALWQRARERELQNGEVGVQDAARQAAARGFAMPPGAMLQQMHIARQDAQEKNSSVSRDIALKRADLYVQNRQFTIDKAKEVQQVLIEYANSYFSRQLDAAKARLETYRISAQVFEAQIQAYSAKVSAQLAGVNMQVAVSEQNVKVYGAKISKYAADLQHSIQKSSLVLDKYKAQISASAVFVDSQGKTIDGQARHSEASARIAVVNSQMRNEAMKAKVAALSAAAELYSKPLAALSDIATAYISSSTSIAAVIE